MRYLPLSFFLLLILPRLCSAEDSLESCAKVGITGGLTYFFQASKVAGLSQSHGPDGPADYVELAVPTELGEGFGVSRIILFEDSEDLRIPVCAQTIFLGRDIMRCSLGVRGYHLKLNVDLPLNQSKSSSFVASKTSEYIQESVICSGVKK